MANTTILQNESGKKIKVNFDAFDSIIFSFDNTILSLSEAKNFIMNNVVDLSEQFSVDTFLNIKETLTNVNSDINKILEILSKFNYKIRQIKAYYENLSSMYNMSSTNIVENQSLSNNPGETDEKNTTGLENIQLKYDEAYNITDNYLTRSKGVIENFNGHRETWYSEKVLPGTGLNIPGRHVAFDGTVRDGDGYIVCASDLSYMPRGTVLMTSLGPAKVYDTGCAYGTIDIYVNW